MLCHYTQENIIAGMKVERMTMLRERYLLYLMEVDADVYNENYKTDKLKDKMKNHLEHESSFGGLHLRVNSYIPIKFSKVRQ